jgi:hypothetical protein
VEVCRSKETKGEEKEKDEGEERGGRKDLQEDKKGAITHYKDELI